MKYISAKDILPDSLVRELQTYIQGGYIYVPMKKSGPDAGERRPDTAGSWKNEISESGRNIETEVLFRRWLKNTACPSMQSGKSFIKSNS